MIFMNTKLVEDLSKAASENEFLNRPKVNTFVRKWETLNTNISNYSQRRIGKPAEHLRWNFFCENS